MQESLTIPRAKLNFKSIVDLWAIVEIGREPTCHAKPVLRCCVPWLEKRLCDFAAARRPGNLALRDLVSV